MTCLRRRAAGRHAYHISYAAWPGTDKEYIRARRYMPGGAGVSGLKNTELEPDYKNFHIRKPE